MNVIRFVEAGGVAKITGFHQKRIFRHKAGFGRVEADMRKKGPVIHFSSVYASAGRGKIRRLIEHVITSS